MPETSELAEFLRSRRARLTPEDVGLRPSLGLRRVPGLRREELAAAAGVSVDYYTRLEQGRASGASEAVLDAIARVLQLDPSERKHLGRLTKPVRPKRLPPQRVRPGLQRVLDSMTDVPAFVLGRRMNVLAWNRLACAMITDFAELEPWQANMPRLVFLHDESRSLYPDWDAVSRETVGYLRWDAGRYPDDPDLAALIGELSIKSDDFRRLWSEHDVLEKTFGKKSMSHPIMGDVEFGYETFTMPGDPDQTLCIYTVEAGSTSESALRLLSSWQADPLPENSRDLHR
ncbi:helix-turn-helix transcriptional regulator [Antrihabitans cavernicola]|uniref:Helix-turn-helix domain-containing protein n=1 Tax=Antrihabitans cavernicola TaxID=2495913 RepID=A0A5A7SKT9_9NOCA|nr:helix-turn-helix transcriptional regulator [Spelaeibacter cavernicola]KAA0024841.1 helix-turn-helix domain-containing protein [Spelaeibacter cavernicola]